MSFASCDIMSGFHSGLQTTWTLMRPDPGIRVTKSARDDLRAKLGSRDCQRHVVYLLLLFSI
jgi:hypothetical protein